MVLLKLFYSYLKIGFFGFGGGYAMLSLLYSEVVVRNEWITNSELADIVAISQMTPGPIAINSATYVGYTVAGFWGSVVATTAVSLPALTLMIIATKFFFKLRRNIYVESVMHSMRPVVIGMIGSAVMMLMFPLEGEGANFIDAWSWAIFAVVFFAAYRKVSLVLLITLSAVAGILIYYVPTLFV
ncbi:MAG: chromate transporter [Rikenellaceae bacterium]